MSPKEEWKPIPGFENLFEISSHGRVMRNACVITTVTGVKRRYKQRPVKTHVNEHGDVVTKLSFGGESIGITIARMMLMAFTKKPAGLKRIPYHSLVADYIDSDRSNLRLDNLRWITRSEAVKRVYSDFREHVKRQSLRIPERAMGISKPVIAKSIKNGSTISFASMSEASEILDVPISAVSYGLFDRGLSGQLHTHDHILKFDDGSPWPKFTNDPSALISRPSHCKVTAVNELTGEERVFVSISEASRMLKASKYGIAAAFREGYEYVIGDWVLQSDGIDRRRLLDTQTLDL